MLNATSLRWRSPRPLLTALVTIVPLLSGTVQAQRESTLAVELAGQRHAWWRSADAPTRWEAPDSAVLAAVRWSRPRPSLRLGELDLLVNRGLLRLRAIIVRVPLSRYQASLERRVERGRAAWDLDQADPRAAVALNAGQFAEAGAWGWLVLDGLLSQLPGTGPLTAGIATDSSGVHWLDPADVAGSYADERWSWGFQSYPVLLRRGAVPPALRTGAGGIDLEHRDIRLALGMAGDTLLLVLTRFAGGGALLERVPAGLTVPETSALMGALGARDAVMLDGGLSAQLLVRGRNNSVRSWRGSRRVPLALLLTERVR